MTETEVLKLRKELLHSRETIEDLQEELRLADEKCLRLQADYERDQETVQQAREQIAKMDSIIEKRIDERLAQEVDIRNKLEELVKDKDKILEQFKEDQKNSEDREIGLKREINYMKGKMDETVGGNYDLQENLKEIKRTRAEADKKESEIARLVQQLNELSKQTENLIAENRILREMAGTPENFGLPINDIKLAEREKIEEYKLRLRTYEKDIHSLEKERAQLKARLRERPTIGGKEDFTRGLTPDQIQLVENFIINIKEGRESGSPDQDKLKEEIERLKAEIQRLQQSGAADIEKVVEKVLSKKGQGRGMNQGDQESLIERIKQENEALINTVRDLAKNRSFAPQDVQTFEGTRKRDIEDLPGARDEKYFTRQLYPPEPIKKSDGSIVDGKSYRFSKMPIAIVPFDPVRYNSDNITKFEFAFMQLALIETVELNSRKDDELKLYTVDLQKIEGKLRSFILQRNELYKDFSKQYSAWQHDGKAMKEQNAELTELLKAERMKNTVLEDLDKTLKSGIKDFELKEKLVELTKRSSILEVSMMQLTRKYLTLQDEYKLLHKQYMNIENENKDKELELEARIMRLKDWKSKAVLELKYLFKKLRESVSLGKYERQQKELEILREKELLWLEAIREVMELRAAQTNMERLRAENEEARKEAEAMHEDAEQELQMVSNRLKAKDPEYATEKAILDRIIESFRTSGLSPQEVFEHIDKDKNGYLSHEEFALVLVQLRLNLSYGDQEAVMRFLDIDNSGSIRYKSFIRTLSRHGIKAKTREEGIIAKIAEAINARNININEAFAVFDRDGNHQISRTQMMDVINSMRLRITEEELKDVINFIYGEVTEKIDYSKFCDYFESYIQKEKEEMKAEKITEKTDILLRIDEKLYEQRISLHSAFIVTKEGHVTKEEFGKVCSKLGIVLKNSELNEIYADFKKDKDKALFSDIAIAIISAKAARAKGKGGKAPIKVKSEEASKKEYDENNVEILKTKVMILLEREKIAIDRMRREGEEVGMLRELVQKRTSECEILEKRVRELTEEKFRSKELVNNQEKRLSNCITKTEANDIERKLEYLERELLDREAAMQTYKGMYEAVVQQMRSLEISFARKKDEGVELHKALLDIQSNNDKDNLIAKIYFVVLLSRWQEATTNRKYDAALTELKRLGSNMYSLETELARKSSEISALEAKFQDSTELLTSLNERVKEKENVGLSQDKARELTMKMKELIQEKINIEIINIELRKKNLKLSSANEQLEVEKQHLDELSTILKANHPDHVLSKKIIELTERFSQLKLSELRAQRDSKMAQEKEVYLEKVNAQSAVQLKKMEEELATALANVQRMEEEFREKDNEREILFFELKQGNRNSEKASNPFKASIKPSESPDEHKSSIVYVKEGTQPETAERIRELEDTVAKMKFELDAKDKLIMGGSKSVTEKSKAEQEITKDVEKRQMADVAYKTIKTLEEIINKQKDQLNRKDDFIKQIREEHAKENEHHIKDMEQLNKELSGQAQNAMGKIISHGKELSYSARRTTPADPTTVMTPEISVALSAKDKEIKKLNAELKQLSTNADKNEKEIRELREKNYELQEKIDKTSREEKISLTRQELEKTKKELDKRNKEYNHLKNAIEALKKDFVAHSEKAITYEADLNSRIAKEKKMDQDKSTLEKQLSKAEKDIQNLTKAAKDAKEAQKDAENKKKLYEQEVQNANRDLEEEKRHRVNLEKEFEALRLSGRRSKEDVKAEGSIISSSKEKDENIELRREIDRLRDELALIKQKAISSGDSILQVNRDLSILEAKETRQVGDTIYIDEIIEQARNLIHPKINPLDILKAYANYQSVITEEKFTTACFKLGLTFAGSSSSVLLNKLKRDPTEVELMYEEFAGALKGMYYVRFIDPQLYSLGELAAKNKLINRDLNSVFKVGEQHAGMVPKYVIEEGLSYIKKDINEEETNYVYDRVKNRFDESTYNALKLIVLIEKAECTYLHNTLREITKDLNMISLFANFDSNKDRRLEKAEFAKLLEEVKMDLDTDKFELMLKIFDPQNKGFVHFDAYCDLLTLNPDQYQDMRIQEERKFRQEVAMLCRRFAKIIISGSKGKLLDTFSELDIGETGLVSIKDAISAVMKLQIKEIKRTDVQILLEELDSLKLNHFCYHSLVRRLEELVQDYKPEALMQRLYSICIRKGAPLNNPTGFKQSFRGVDKEGKIPAKNFRMHMQDLIRGITEDELSGLENSYQKEGGKIDLKMFIEDLFSPNMRKAATTMSMLGSGNELMKTRKDAKELLEKSAVAKQALDGEVAQLKKEKENLKKENIALSQKITSLEKNKPDMAMKTMESKLEKTKKDTTLRRDETGNVTQYSKKITELEEKNYSLEKKIESEFKPQISKFKNEIDKLKTDIKFLKLDNLKLEAQVDKMLKKPLDAVEKKSELENLKDAKIKEQHHTIEETIQETKALKEQIFVMEKNVLELRYEKENFDLERSRLQRRIKDLEDFQAVGTQH